LRGRVNFAIRALLRLPSDHRAANPRLAGGVSAAGHPRDGAPEAEVISPADASFIRRAVSRPSGWPLFFNGTTSRPERGLEISTLAVVEVNRRCALTLAVAQTPPGFGP